MSNNKERLAQRIDNLKIYALCDGIKKGIPYEKTNQQFQTLPKNDNYAYGEFSVLNVKRVINSLPLKDLSIDKVEETSWWSFQDTILKHDLEIFSNKKGIGLIGIQVKSSLRSELKFYKKINPDYEIAKQILIQKKLIVLNGQIKNDEVIKKFFLEKLKKIEQHHQRQS